MISTSRRWRPLLIVGLSAAALLLAGWVFSRIDYRPLDFHNYVAAAAELAAGRSPYDAVEFFAPPWVALILVPLTWLPPAFSAGLWLLASLAAVLAISALWIDHGSYPAGRRAPLLAGAAAVLSPTALYVYVTGQITALAGAALVYLIVSDRRWPSRPWLAAAAVLLASAKPHIVGIPLLFLLLDDLRRGERRLPATAAASLGAAGAVSLVVLPSWPREWLSALRSADYLGGSGLVAEGYIGFRELGIPGVLLVLPLLYSAVYWYRRGPTPAAVALALAGGLIWLPYTRAYDQILLWPAALCGAAAWQSSRARLMFAVPLASFFGLPLTDLSLVLPLVLTALLVARISIRDTVGSAEHRPGNTAGRA